MGPICLIIDDEGAISCLRSQGEEQRRLAVEELGKLERSVLLIPVGLSKSHMFDPRVSVSLESEAVLIAIHRIFLLRLLSFECK